MKLLHVADLHLQHEWFDWVASNAPEHDLLVISGDLQNAFSGNSMHDQARAVSKWLLSLTTPTVVCSGNHDFWVSDPRVTVDVQAEAGWLKNLRGRGAIVGVDGSVIERGGLRILVNGWLQVPAVDGPVDIVVTHAPPAGCKCAWTGHDNGDPDLWPALQYHPPLLLLCGHCHAPDNIACSWPPVEPTTWVLLPGCDEEEAIPSHWVIDTTERCARHSSGEMVKYGVE